MMSPAKPSREEAIRAMAHTLWEEAGRPDGQAEAHWARATEIVDAQAAAEKPAKPAPTTAKAPPRKAPARKKR